MASCVACRILQQDAAVLEPSPVIQVLFALLLLVGGLVIIPARRFLTRELLDREPPTQSAFLWIDLAGTLLAFLVGQLLVAGVLDHFYPNLEDLEEIGTVKLLGLTAAGFLVPAGYVVFAAFSRAGGLEQLGLKSLTPGYRLPFGGLLYLAGLPMFLGLGALSAVLMEVLGGPTEQGVAVLIRDGISETPWSIAFFAVLVVPLFEEILFRGFLLELVTAKFGRVQGILVSSLALSLIHISEPTRPY